MGLPSIDIDFRTKALTAIQRSARGIVAMIIRDNTEQTFDEAVFKSVADVDFTKIKARNYDYFKLIYLGVPSKVIAINIKAGNVSAALKKLEYLKFNYLVMPEATQEETLTISAWIKEQRNKKKTYKAVLAKSKSDSEGIINLTTDNIKSIVSDTVFNTAEYTARIAGMLAGLPLSRSSTYFVFDDIVSAAMVDDPDAKIDAGEFIIYFDGEKYKVGRGVNSYTSFTKEKGKDYSKIKIIEGIDLYNDDIKETYDDFYVGKFINDYDNKQMFVGAVNAYNKALEGDVLDKSADNVTTIDVEAQRLYLESQGISTEGMDDVKIKTANTGAFVFLQGNLKFVDAMEDLKMFNHL